MHSKSRTPSRWESLVPHSAVFVLAIVPLVLIVYGLFASPSQLRLTRVQMGVIDPPGAVTSLPQCFCSFCRHSLFLTKKFHPPSALVIPDPCSCPMSLIWHCPKRHSFLPKDAGPARGKSLSIFPSLTVGPSTAKALLRVPPTFPTTLFIRFQ
ncbi:hypothetical protein EDB86DRAFT_3155841 [Lactarius hatsudake]|nr:hypothetical protein EDB86DRAFT_3155841 [Lactarius hatsudake]